MKRILLIAAIALICPLTGAAVSTEPPGAYFVAKTGALLSMVMMEAAPTPTLGNYPDTTIPLSTDMTVTPDTAPTNTTSINVSTSTNFKGKLEGDPMTGVVRVTDAHPAGTYTVTLTAFQSGGAPTMKTFMLTVTTPATCTPVSFAAATNFDTGDGPFSVAVGDFNGDGKQDLAVANRISNNVSISLGNGAGSFSAATNFDVGSFPESVAVGDFNGDGKQDLAVANAISNNVSILLGDGAGNFSAATNFGVADIPTSVAVGDFNDDGKQDLAVANSDSAVVSILLGDGAGNFSAATNFGVGSFLFTVAVGDFNGDGKQDLAVARWDSNNVSILLGDGAGNFSTATTFGVGDGPFSVAVGDFNGDGKQDLATANRISNNVSILLGDGAGSFSANINFGAGSDPRSVAIGDFDGDGKQDLAVANSDSNNVSILLRDCAATPPTPTPTPINISGSVTYCSNPLHGPVPNVVLTLTGTISESTLSDGSGNYTLSSLPSGGSYVVTPSKAALTPGSDGIDTVDVLATQMHYLEIALLPAGCPRDAADVNSDTGINTVDVLAIQRFFIGRTFGLANVGKYQFTPANRTYTGITSNRTLQDYDALVYGDVAAGFVHRPEGPSQTAIGDGTSASEVPATVAVALPNTAVDASVTDFIVQVTTTAMDAKNKLVGFQGDFTFDEKVVSFQSEPVQNAGLTGSNWNVSGNVLDGPGPIRTLRVSAYSNDLTPLSGSGTLFELRMTRVSKAAQGTQLLWAAPPDHFMFIDADLNVRKPEIATPGSVTRSGKRN